MPSAILPELETFGPDRCQTLTYEQADAYTQKLAKTHYENFTVVSWLLPKRLRDDFRHVYAFCRWADDLGDETGDTAESLRLLDWWKHEIDLCYAGTPRHPVFVALRPTIEKHDLPRKPFDDLVDAFVQDQTVFRYASWDQVLDYCTRSANPVGRLVLYLCGYRDDERQQLSDATCTALQLANFWQDVRRDIIERDRVYVPRDVAGVGGLDVELMVKAVHADIERGPGCGCGGSSCRTPTAGIRGILPAYRTTLQSLVQRTWPLFERGRDLWPMLAPDIRLDIELFTLGGESILRMIEKLDYDTLTRRPSLTKPDKLSLMFRAIWGKFTSWRTGRSGDAA